MNGPTPPALPATPSAAGTKVANDECEDLRAALARVVAVVDGGQSTIYRVLQQTASIRHARSLLDRQGARA